MLGDSGSVDLSEFWLSEEQFERLRPLLPDKVRGVARVDDRRVISGIIHVVKSGGRWVDAPPCYGPRTSAGGPPAAASVTRSPAKCPSPPTVRTDCRVGGHRMCRILWNRARPEIRRRSIWERRRALVRCEIALEIGCDVACDPVIRGPEQRVAFKAGTGI